MIDNFIIEKLLELIPTKNKEDVELQKEMNQITFVPKNLNFEQECFRILNKIKPGYKNPEIKQFINSYKKHLLSKNKNYKILLFNLYILTKLIKEEDFSFEKCLDSEMAEIDLSISMTSFEIQIEELLKIKLNFDDIFNNRQKLLFEPIYKSYVMQRTVSIYYIGDLAKKIMINNKFHDTLNSLKTDLKGIKRKNKNIDEMERKLKNNQKEICKLNNEIYNLKSIIKNLEINKNIYTDNNIIINKNYDYTFTNCKNPDVENMKNTNDTENNV